MTAHCGLYVGALKISGLLDYAKQTDRQLIMAIPRYATLRAVKMTPEEIRVRTIVPLYYRIGR